MSLHDLYADVRDPVTVDTHLTDIRLQLPQKAHDVPYAVLGPFALLAAAGEMQGYQVVDDYHALMERVKRSPPAPFPHGYLVSCLSIKELNGQPATYVPDVALNALKELT